MATLFRMPELAANTTEAVLGAWLVAENAAFAAGEALVTVETDKASVDLEAETDGVLLRALVPAGASVDVGTPIAVLGVAGESADGLDVAGVGAGGGVDRGAEADSSGPDKAADSGAGNGTALASARIFTSPLARRLATEAGLDLATITGTGPGGRVVRRDVTAAIATTAIATAKVPAPPVEADPRPAPPPTTIADHDDTPHTRMRRAIATRLAEAKQTIPHFYVRATCRVDKLLALRTELNAAGPDHVSVNDLILKAAARAHVLVPAANAIWTETATRRFATADLAVAIATETGLVTPVLHAVERTPVSVVAARVRDFADRARAGTLRPDELVGGTLTVTNLGMHGIQEFAAIINPPQSMILAVGAARPEPVVQDGAVTVATVLRVTLSVDHRVIDGVLAAEWLNAFAGVLENPVRALL
jgi:pyruvate dehydrogenase E2 component (dihydrolipoamide acetyltransferase)